MSKGVERATRRSRTFAELAKSVRIEKSHEASREVAASRELSDAARAALFDAPVDNDRDFYARIAAIRRIFGED
ncbi:MAG: hypothetical protein JOZ53_23345 [Planctomycetaceae bacterium]|nr:hypothetical protein [Planctomycetaceae bacterium]